MTAWARPLGAGMAAFAIAARILWPGDAAGTGLNLLLDAVAMLAAAVVCVGEERLRAAHAGWVLAGLGVWGAVSGLWAGEVLPAMSTAASWFAAGALAVAVAQSARETAIHVLTASAAAQAGYALWQRFEGLAQVRAAYLADPSQMPFSSPAERIEFESRLFTDEAFGTFATSNVLCAFVAVSLPVVVGRLLDAPSKRARLCLAPAALALFLAALATKSKGGLVAIAAAAAVFAWRVWEPEGQRRLRTGLAGLGAAVALGVLMLAIHPGPFNWTNPKTSLGYRANYARGSVGVIGEAPVLGVGASNWNAHYTAHMTPTAGEAQRAHFDALQILGETGPLGLALFLAIAILALRSFLASPPDVPPAVPLHSPLSPLHFPWPAAIGLAAAIGFNEALEGRLRGTGALAALAIIALLTAALAGSSESPIGRFTKAGACAGAAGFFVHGLVEYDLYVPGLVFAFASTLGLASGAETRWRGRLVAALPTLVAIPVLLHAGPFMQADAVLDKARAGKATVEEVREARELNPYEADLPYFEAGIVHAGAHKSEECLGALDAAIKLAPFQSGLYQRRASFREAHQDLTGALEDYDRAVKLYPNQPQLRLMRGRARKAAKVDGWREDLEEALELSPKMDMVRRALTPEEIEEVRKSLGATAEKER